MFDRCVLRAAGPNDDFYIFDSFDVDVGLLVFFVRSIRTGRLFQF